jgi:hypothetical protein
VVFPGLDGTFRCVAAMLVCRDSFEINIVLGERFFEICGTLVVKDVKLWCVPVVLKEVEDA